MGVGEITRPALAGVVVKERGPGLLGGKRSTGLVHVPLDGALGDRDVQLEQFSADAFGAPGAVLVGHLPDQCHILECEWCSAGPCPSLRAMSPYATEQVAVPAQEGIRLDNQQGLFPGAQLAGQQHEHGSVGPGE